MKWLPWMALVVVVSVALAIGASDRGGPETVTRARRAGRARRALPDVQRPFGRRVRRRRGQGGSRRHPTRRRSRPAATREIRAALAARYGDDIVLTPDPSGVTGLVWVLPVAVLVGGAGFLWIAFRRWRA